MNSLRFNKIFKKIIFILFFSQLNVAFSQIKESISSSLYNSGYYTEAIKALKAELSAENDTLNRSRILYKIADAYYGMSFVEDYKRYADKANDLLKKSSRYTFFNKVEYSIALIRYYNFEIKPNESIKIYEEIYPKFHRIDPERKSKLWISFYQNIATTRRNNGANYKQMCAEYDTVYMLLKRHNLLNTINEIHYCRARGNMNLDRVRPDSAAHYYNEALKYFNKGISISKRFKNRNYPYETIFQCLKGLVSYLKRDVYVSNDYFHEAYYSIDKCAFNGYKFNDYISIALNIYNWSFYPIQIIYEKSKDLSIIKKQALILTNAINSFNFYSKKNKDVDINIFTDIYGYSPIKNLVTCHISLYLKTLNKNYLDSAFYYTELNKTSWIPMDYDYNSFKSYTDKLIKRKNVIIQYGEFGLLERHNFLYAIVKNKDGLFLKTLCKEEQNDAVRDLSKWDYKNYVKESYTYYNNYFKPLEKYIPKNVNRIIVNNHPFFNLINIESWVTDTILQKNKFSFLIYNYQFCVQPSLRVFNNSNKPQIIRTNCLISPQYDKNSKIAIRFTSNYFKSFLKEINIKKNNSLNQNSDLITVIAHGYSNLYKVDRSYIDLNSNKLSISRICKLRLPNTKLAILAFCEGGKGQSITMSSNFTFASAFMMAGVKSCLFSNWKLDDEITATILKDFFNELKQGRNKDVALRNAKLNYLSKVKSITELNPIYWAGLKVIGDVSPIEFKSNTNNSYLFWVFLSVFLLFLGFISFKILRR